MTEICSSSSTVGQVFKTLTPLLPVSLPANMPGDVHMWQKMASVSEIQKPQGKTRIDFWAPGFFSLQP